MNTNRAKDQARHAGRHVTALQKLHAEIEDSAALEPERAAPRASAGRGWTVRIHWGLVFAVAASLVLWFGIKTLIGLAF